MWPRLVPHELLHDLYGARSADRRRPGGGILSADECALLHRPRSASFDDVPWTAADAALVDEARHLLGPRQGGADDAIRRYGHIVVDEVQDLSALQLRMLARRSISGSMTVVGDIAQATAPVVGHHLGRRHPAPPGGQAAPHRGAHRELPDPGRGPRGGGPGAGRRRTGARGPEAGAPDRPRAPPGGRGPGGAGAATRAAAGGHGGPGGRRGAGRGGGTGAWPCWPRRRSSTTWRRPWWRRDCPLTRAEAPAAQPDRAGHPAAGRRGPRPGVRRRPGRRAGRPSPGRRPEGCARSTSP